MTAPTVKPLQAQAEAARFASTITTIDERRRRAIRTALDLLRRGDQPAALRAMYAGLTAQAPLTFKAPDL